ncbi:MAG: hypothetical protein WAN86_12980 [Hyphomicrobiaceae bacterium]
MVAQASGVITSPGMALRPYQPRNELSVADIHPITLRPEFEGMVVPSKFYGIAAAGWPAIFIGDPNGEMTRVIARAGCGESVRQGDGAGHAEAMLQLASNPADCREVAAAPDASSKLNTHAVDRSQPDLDY